MASIRPATVFWFMVLLLGGVVAWELGLARGRVVECPVEEVLPGSKGSTVFARCDGVLTKVPVSDIASTLHGQPTTGRTITVRETKRGALWDKPAARHPVSVGLAPFFLLASLVLWWRRNA